MTDERFVTFIQKRVDFPQRVGVVHDEHQLSLHPCTPGCPCDHIAGQNFTEVADVEFAAGCDAGGDDVLIASLSETLGHHVAPVHLFTSNSDGSNQAT